VCGLGKTAAGTSKNSKQGGAGLPAEESAAEEDDDEEDIKSQRLSTSCRFLVFAMLPHGCVIANMSKP